MSTNANQILNRDELDAKIGGRTATITSIPNRSQITSIWSSAYITISGTDIIPNNGEIWPLKRLKKGSTPGGAYSSSLYYNINFRDANWNIGSSYTFDTNCTAYIDNNPVSGSNAGWYYMEDGTNKWYYITNNGVITGTGIYEVPYFNFNQQYVQLGIGQNVNGTVTYSTNISSPYALSKYKYPLSGGSGTTSSISTSFSGSTMTINRSGSFDLDKPIVVITAGDTEVSDKVLVYPPWTLSGQDISVAAAGATVTPIVSTNMASYTLSSNQSWARVSGTSVIVSSNVPSSGSNPQRTATITISATVSGTYDGISYSDSKTATLTLTQAKGVAVKTVYVLARKRMPGQVYLSRSRTSYSSYYLEQTTAGIVITNMEVVNQDSETAYGEASISVGDSTGPISWQNGANVSTVSTVVSAGNVSWELNIQPEEYQLGENNVIWIS